jgi:protein-S-isoprenylcysteine O-methyltransferase Ste14
MMRSTIKKDLLYFCLPAFVVFATGLVVSGWDGYDGLVETLWGLLTQKRGLEELSSSNVLGLFLFVIGMTIALVSARTLRGFYASTLLIRDGHQLITRGIYRFIRHPIYFGVIIICFSVPLYAPSLNGFFVMSILVPLFLIRIRMEEAMLTEEFGEAYRTYMRETKKLIPFTY